MFDTAYSQLHDDPIDCRERLGQEKEQRMGKVLELSEDTYERLLVLAQQRECTPEEFIHMLLVDTEQAQYYQANQQMLAQGVLASIPRIPGGTEAIFTPVELSGPPLSQTILDDRR